MSLGEHVLNSLGISTRLVSLHISLYCVQDSRNNALSLSVALDSMTGWSVFFRIALLRRVRGSVSPKLDSFLL